MRDQTVYLIKPDGSLGYEFKVGLIDDNLVEEEARRAAVEDGAGTTDEVASWSLMMPPSNEGGAGSAT